MDIRRGFAYLQEQAGLKKDAQAKLEMKMSDEASEKDAKTKLDKLQGKEAINYEQLKQLLTPMKEDGKFDGIVPGTTNVEGFYPDDGYGQGSMEGRNVSYHQNVQKLHALTDADGNAIPADQVKKNKEHFLSAFNNLDAGGSKKLDEFIKGQKEAHDNGKKAILTDTINTHKLTVDVAHAGLKGSKGDYDLTDQNSLDIQSKLYNYGDIVYEKAKKDWEKAHPTKQFFPDGLKEIVNLHNKKVDKKAKNDKAHYEKIGLPGSQRYLYHTGAIQREKYAPIEAAEDVFSSYSEGVLGMGRGWAGGRKSKRKSKKSKKSKRNSKKPKRKTRKSKK